MTDTRSSPGAAAAVAARRRLRGWLAAVAAAAVVVALAVSLAMITGLRNGPAASATALPSSSGVPPYYLALSPQPGWFPGEDEASLPVYDLVVGDTFTGTELATIAAPKGTTFAGVTAAADDRTFVTYAIPTTLGGGLAGTWYKVTLTPGAASPATLTRLPVKPLTGVAAMALSGSGQELAVVRRSGTGLTTGPTSLCVYLVATGGLVHCWSTSDQAVFDLSPEAGDGNLAPALTWVDGDRALAFPVIGPTAQETVVGKTIRLLNLSASGADLMADSRVVWSGDATPAGATLPAGSFVTVNGDGTISADGKTVSLAVAGYQVEKNGDKIGPWRVTWVTYPASPAGERGGSMVFDYDLAVGRGIGEVSILSPLWVNASGTALLGAWAVSDSKVPVHFGVLSQGKFTPLPVPVPRVFDSVFFPGIGGGFELAITW
jgi:hypothetical protein